jgi:4-amino-4-deoxy-L-arabinose transferase-like glycosyltransferase
MKSIFKHGSKYLNFFSKYKAQIPFLLLLVTFIFLRFYQLPERAMLGWDQADSAWAANSILHENPIRLEGVPIKGNASMFMGPLYYYLITPFYFFTKLDMIASPIFAGAVSVVNFGIFYYATKKLFDTKIALVASFLYSFSMSVLLTDKVQAAYVLIPILSYVIFYFLYKIVTGYEENIVYLVAAIGLGFHFHFTTIFYLPIILLTLPFFPRTRKTLLHILFSIPVFFVLTFPIIYSAISKQQSGANSLAYYLSSSYHGLHLRRVFQLSHDGFISFEAILQTNLLRPFVFCILPLFAVVFYKMKPKKDRRKALLFSYLVSLWILIPWISFSMYNGELTDYYFSLPRNLGIAMIAFLLVSLYQRKTLLSKLAVVFLLVFFATYNLLLFTKIEPGNYLGIKQSAQDAIKMNKKIKFKDRDPLYYIYYVETKYGKNR